MVKFIDFDNYNKFIKVIYILLLITIFSAQVYLIFMVYPREREIFLECEEKILCKYGYLPKNMCFGHEYGQIYSRNPNIEIPIYDPNPIINTSGFNNSS